MDRHEGQVLTPAIAIITGSTPSRGDPQPRAETVAMITSALPHAASAGVVGD
jgi:hypothetical protein